MSDRPHEDAAVDAAGDTPELTAEEKAARAKRLAEVFGDVLPEQTSDDRDPGETAGDGDAWLRAQVPPHHG
jgi:hypothetical protein